MFIVGRRKDQLDKAVRELGANALGVQADIAKPAELDALVDAVRKKGKVDVIFANAGGGTFTALGDISEAQLDKELGINVKGTVFTVQKLLPVMADGGAIVINASVAAQVGSPAFSVYAATKAAVRSFARGWTVDLKGRHIRVNSISPGVVPTEGYETQLGLTAEQVEAFAKDMAAQNPLGRVGTPDEIAKAVVFLASDDSSFITGIDLVVDGGHTQV